MKSQELSQRKRGKGQNPTPKPKKQGEKEEQKPEVQGWGVFGLGVGEWWRVGRLFMYQNLATVRLPPWPASLRPHYGP